MISDVPDWLNEEPHRKRSIRQEKKLAKRYSGRVTANSGASLGENDITTGRLSIEAKITENKGYRINIPEFLKAASRAGNKMPIEIIEFSSYGESLVVLREIDFFTLIGSLENK